MSPRVIVSFRSFLDHFWRVWGSSIGKLWVSEWVSESETKGNPTKVREMERGGHCGEDELFWGRIAVLLGEKETIEY